MISKEFTTEEYFKDWEFITNSHLKYYEKCPHYYSEKKAGNVQEIEKDYFTYGKLVDTILSGKNIEDNFCIGGTKESPEELRMAIKILEEEIDELIINGKTKFKAKTDRLEKLNEKLELSLSSEGKTSITETVLAHGTATAKEMKSQPLYSAFDNCKTQTIIAIEINGIKVKGMFDKLDLENKILCDDKTTANMNTFDPRMYLQQLAWYRWIVRENYGIEVDCYLAVGDKFTDYKRSSMFYISPALLDWQEQLNKELLEKFLAEKDFIPVTETNENAREEICFKCDHYTNCQFSRQKSFIII